MSTFELGILILLGLISLPVVLPIVAILAVILVVIIVYIIDMVYGVIKRML